MPFLWPTVYNGDYVSSLRHFSIQQQNTFSLDGQLCNFILLVGSYCVVSDVFLTDSFNMSAMFSVYQSRHLGIILFLYAWLPLGDYVAV